MISNNKLIGSWKNSKATTICISEFALASSNDEMTLDIIGAKGGVMPDHLGPIKVSRHFKDNTSNDCIAFHGQSEVNGKKYAFAGNINKGLIIIATYIIDLKDASQNGFIREFFYKLK